MTSKSLTRKMKKPIATPQTVQPWAWHPKTSRCTNFRGNFRENFRGREGSILVLVIVAITLMAMMGAVYLQATRVQRFATSTREGNIEAVEQSIIALIITRLTEDLENGDEMYDYDWTNTTDPAMDPDNAWPITMFFTSGTQTAWGGLNDDAYLASSEPDFSSNTWPHITNLAGHFLRNTTGTGNAWELRYVTNPSVITPTRQLTEDVVTIGPNNTDTGIPLNTGATMDLLVDADGDGIGDSRWAWAPITQINGLMYTMAVRIVDLSGKVNINTALSVGKDTAGSWTYDASALGDDAPFWNTPAEIDLGRFVFAHDPTAMDQLRASLIRRIDASLTIPASPSTLIPGMTRDSFWQDTGSYYSEHTTTPATGGALYGLDSAYSLLHRNGVSSDGVTRDIEADMGSFLRDGDGETDYSTAYANEASFFTNEPRHKMTAISGFAIFAPRLPNDTNSNPPLKVNINDTANAQAISDRIKDVYSEGTPTIPGGLADATEFSNQFTANLLDFIDVDSEVTELNGSYGLEALPFLVNVYAQRAYSITSSIDLDPGTPDRWNVTWTQTGAAGYAIEIANPFNQPISLQGVTLSVGGISWGDVAGLWGAANNIDLDGDATDDAVGLEPGEVLILYRLGAGGNNNDVMALFSGTPAPVTNAIAQTWPTTGSVDVELTATLAGGGGNTPVYSRITADSIPDSLLEPAFVSDSISNDGVDPLGQISERQIAFVGNGNGLNILTFDETGTGSVIVDVRDRYMVASVISADNYEADATAWVLGPADKTAVGPGDVTSLTSWQLLIPNIDTLSQIGEIGMVTSLGFTTARTVGASWNQGAGTALNNYMLDFSASAMIDNTKDNFNIPHAVFLIDQLMTFDPRSDGVDNDGVGGIDDNDESIVPGPVNINTAPQTLLEDILPIPDPALRANIAKAIVDYRKDPARRLSATGAEGIAYLGELFTTDMLLDDPNGTNSGFNYLAYDGMDTETLNDGTGNIKIDFLNAPSMAGADGFANDREEQQMIAKWLSQVGSVRSDYFAAYVLVSEWEWPGAGGVPNNSSQFVVILRRNAVSGAVSVEAVLDGGNLYRY